MITKDISKPIQKTSPKTIHYYYVSAVLTMATETCNWVYQLQSEDNYLVTGHIIR